MEPSHQPSGDDAVGILRRLDVQPVVHREREIVAKRDHDRTRGGRYGRHDEAQVCQVPEFANRLVGLLEQEQDLSAVVSPPVQSEVADGNEIAFPGRARLPVVVTEAHGKVAQLSAADAPMVIKRMGNEIGFKINRWGFHAKHNGTSAGRVGQSEQRQSRRLQSAVST